MDKQTQMGPPSAPSSGAGSELPIRDSEGAELLVGGSMMNVPGFEEGCYVEPSLLAASTLDNVAAREEIFGQSLSCSFHR